MDGPGMSLFQGSGSIHIDNDNHRIEEEEAIQDQQRRNEELGNILENAFDDLIDDDDGSSILSDDTNLARSRTSMYLLGGGDANVSSHSAHYKHCYRTSPGSIDALERHDKVPHVNEVVNGHSTEPLKALYDVRTREMERLAEETERWRQQVALKDAEKERLQMTLKQQSSQLALANNRIEDLAAEVGTLKQNILNAENSKSSAFRELESCRATISELQSLCDSLQRSRDVESRSDAILLTSEQRHQQETKVLMSRIDDLQNNLTLKTVQQERTLHKIAQMSRDHEALLLQRTETIVGLTADLEDAQRHAKKLTADLDVSQRQTKLVTDDMEASQRQIKLLTADLEAAQRQIKLLTAELESTERKTSHHGTKRRADVSELSELNGKLKEELERCVGGLRTKREETRKLQEMIDMKETVIKNLLEQEACCATQVSKFREETEQLYKECKEKELHATELRKQNERLRETNETLRRDISKLELQATRKKLVFSAQADVGTSPRSDADAEVEELKNRLELALTENENIKKLYVEICEAKDQTIAELTRLRAEYNQLWSRDENGRMKMAGGNVERQAPNTSIINDTEEFILEEGDLPTQVARLKAHYQSKLDEEIVKQTQQFRETEELIKQEAIKLFSDDIEALETRRDDAVYDLEQCQTKLSLCKKQLHDMKALVETKLESKNKELERLQKDCDEKVSLLKEAERRFEVFEANTCDEFEKLSNEQQKTIEKLVVKYKALKKMMKDLKAQTGKENGKNFYRTKIEAYKSSLTEIDRRMSGLINSAVIVKEKEGVLS